jgi:hypothetical protein
VIIRGFFVADAPFFSARVLIAGREADCWFLTDTGAACTLLMDHDAEAFDLAVSDLEPASAPLMGISGAVRPFLARGAAIQFASFENMEFLWRHNLLVVRRDVRNLSPMERARIRRLPSLLGRDFLKKFRFVCDHQSGHVFLER